MGQKEKLDDYLISEVGEAEAERRRLARERSLANLKPWQRGQSGGGRRASGAYVKEAVNAMMIVDENGARYSLDQIRQIAESPESGPAYVMAAWRILTACRDPAKWVIDEEGETYYAGSDPEPGRAFEQIADRLEGKPATTLHVTRTDAAAHPDDLRRELLQHMISRPGLVRFLLEQVSTAAAAGTLPPEFLEPVDPATDPPSDAAGDA